MIFDRSFNFLCSSFLCVFVDNFVYCADIYVGQGLILTIWVWPLRRTVAWVSDCNANYRLMPIKRFSCLRHLDSIHSR